MTHDVILVRLVPKARKQFENALYYPDGYILRVRVWEVPEPVPPSGHRFKYSCFYGRPGERIVLYDNEKGKGDHRHYGERQVPYKFRSVKALMTDFLADVRRARGGDK
jgi:Family of unknown function (DUF6516)